MNRVTEILSGERAVIADTALRLARSFGTSARFWMNLQLNYDLAVVEGEQGESIAQRVSPRRLRPAPTLGAVTTSTRG
jgi:antitoxin HigA-1